MKQMKHFLIAIAAFICLPTMADDYQWLGVMYQNGTEDITSMADFSNITFDKGVMKLNNGATVVKSFDTKQLRKMYFKADNTAIALPSTDIDADAPMMIVNTTGMMVGSQMSDLEQLPRGIYVIKQGTNARKIVKK